MSVLREIARSTVALGLAIVAAAGGLARCGRADEGILSSPGGTLAGTLVPAAASADGGPRTTLLWQSPLFEEPFEFAIDELTAITFERPGVPPPRPGTVDVRLRGGDLVNGWIESLDETHVGLRRGGPGGSAPLKIARDQIESIARPGGGGGSFTGPAGLGGWQQSPADAWREDAGGIKTGRPGAEVSRDVSAPQRARFDVVISWRAPSEFRLSVAAGDAAETDPYFLELLRPRGEEAGLVAVRREAGAAAIEPLAPQAVSGDSLHVVLFVDQQRGRLAVVVPGMEAAAGGGPRAVELTVAPPADRPPSGRVRLALSAGDLCLESLRVSPWLADDPVLEESPETVITTRDEKLRGAAVQSFDAAAGEFVVRAAGIQRRLAVDAVDEIAFPASDALVPRGQLRIVDVSGDVLSGDLAVVDDAAVWLRRAGIDGAVAVPRGGIRLIRGLGVAAEPRGLPGRVGRLVAPPEVSSAAAPEPETIPADAGSTDRPVAAAAARCSMRGCLVAAEDDDGIAWRPVGSLTGGRFKSAAGGQPSAILRYVEPPAIQAAGSQVGGIGGMVSLNPEGAFVVMMLVDDGAAARDGRLQPGDRITAVKPEAHARFVEAAGLDNETLTSLLRGRIGTPVRLRVVDAQGGAPREIELVRRPIRVASRRLLDEALRVHVELGGEEPAAAAGADGFPELLILRSGDVAVCRVHAIDGEAVELETPLAEDRGRVRVAAELVRAVELLPSAPTRELDQVLFERLLTLPRMQRSRPPTHLLRLVNGDYLRGRLESLDERTARIEVLGAVKSLPRGQVARVIWLDAADDPAAGPEAAAGEGPADAGLIVQGVAADGRRITLMAEGLQGSSLRGRSRAFGPARLDIDAIDTLLIGGAVGRDAGELPYSKWRLRPATEPRGPRRDAASAAAGD